MRMLLVFLAVVGLSDGRTDQTRTPGAIGQDVIQASIKSMQDACIFSNDRQFMRRLAWVESRFGNDPNTFVNRIDGVWHLSRADFNATVNYNKNTERSILSNLAVNYSTLGFAQGSMLIPLYNAIATRYALSVKEKRYRQIPFPLNDQAQFWSQYYGDAAGNSSTDFLNAMSNIPDPCSSSGADILFILDHSGSIGTTNWKTMIDFVADIIGRFPFGMDAYRFAVDYFGDNAETVIHFNTTTNITALQQMIKKLPYRGGNTRTDLALNRAVQYSFTAANGVRDPVQGYPRVAVILTDGQSTDQAKTIVAARMAHQSGLNMFTVGIGSSANQNELNTIASDPVCLHTYLLTDFNALTSGFPDDLKAQTCVSATIVNSNQTSINKTIAKQQDSYFQFSASLSTGITFKTRVAQGEVVLYLSQLFQRPSSVQYDFMVTVKQNQLGQIYLSGSDLNQGSSDPPSANVARLFNEKLAAAANSTTPVYVTVQGQSDSNTFEMNIDAGDTRESPSSAVHGSSVSLVAIVISYIFVRILK